MPNAIRSIATRYHGVTFRSLLEARWAVFFDAMQIPWQYEPECQFLDEGPYLPDFLLWDSLHVEVKPALTPAHLEEQYETLIRRVDGLGALLVLTGKPRIVWYPVLTKAPPGTAWLDFARSATKCAPVWLVGSRCPPLEDLPLDLDAYQAAVIAAHDVETSFAAETD